MPHRLRCKDRKKLWVSFPHLTILCFLHIYSPVCAKYSIFPTHIHASYTNLNCFLNIYHLLCCWAFSVLFLTYPTSCVLLEWSYRGVTQLTVALTLSNPTSESTIPILSIGFIYFSTCLCFLMIKYYIIISWEYRAIFDQIELILVISVFLVSCLRSKKTSSKTYLISDLERELHSRYEEHKLV